MAEQRKTFRTPWSYEESGEAFVVSNADGLPLTYTYFADEGRAAYFNKPRLTKDEARRLAANIAKLPELLEIAKNAKAGFFPDT